MEFIHEKMIINGKIYPIQQAVSEPGIVIYEVLRLLDGIPVFFEKHFKRLENSSNILNHKLQLKENQIKKNIHQLIESNGIPEGNIKINLTINDQGHEFLQAGFIPHHYPETEIYRKGVIVQSLTAYRINPNAKVVQQELRDLCNEIISKQEIFEVALVNQEAYITEGSRSNIFFIKNTSLYTAPEKEVLAGITRNMVLDLARELGIEVFEKSVNIKEIAEFDACFITGTSPKVLQINRFDDQPFIVNHPVYKKIAGQYENLILQYIASYQKNQAIQE